MPSEPVASDPPTIVPSGDEAVLVDFGDRIDPSLNHRVLALDRLLTSSPVPGMVETVPALASLLVRFDPDVVTHDAVRDALEAQLATNLAAEAPAPRRGWTIPVLYGGEVGIHLDEAAERLDLSPEELAARHAAEELRVLMLGFTPGFAYLGIGGEEWALPRRPTIVREVPPGAVIVAVRQTGVCSTTMPTGWWVIGHTPLRTFDPDADEPFLFEPGDRVRFETLSEEEHQGLTEAVAAGYRATPDPS